MKLNWNFQCGGVFNPKKKFYRQGKGVGEGGLFGNLNFFFLVFV